jgi:desampylase
MRVQISSEALAAIRAHAASDPEREVCGLLLGTDTVEAAQPALNVAADPLRHFEIDPASLFAAIRAERTGGPRLLGYYHSHPRGRAEPSVTDQASAAEDGKIWVIVGADEVRAWRAGENGLDAIELSQI